MDVGRFARRKTELWAWILGPLLVIWITHASVLLYHLIAESKLAGLEAHDTIVPELLDNLTAVENHLGVFHQLPASESEAMAAITTLLDEAEEESGFAVSSVRAERAPESRREDVRTLQVSVIGAGELVEIVRFADSVQKPECLIDVAVANLNIMAADEATIYSAKFVFRCHNMDLGQRAAGARRPSA